MTRKRGKLSLDEQNFIVRNVHELSVKEIAENLNRTTAPVEKFIKQNDLRGTGNTEESLDILMSKLKHRPYYEEVTLQLTDTELTYFEQNWVNLMLQFREDVMYSEELSLKQLIILDILMNRSMIERRAHQEDANRLQRMLDDEMEKDPEDRDRDYILNLETQLAFARTSITSYTNEHTKLLKERRDIDRSLKTTREQRIKRVEDGKSSFTGWLRSLEDADERARWGEYAELMRMSLYRAKERLSENHVYDDGKVDIPFLTVETAKDSE
jgi:hypothetical protein